MGCHILLQGLKIAVLFIIAKAWKALNCPSTNEWVKLIWYVYARGYYLATRKKEILLFVTTWMNLEDIMLNEINQIKQTNKQTLYDLTHYVCVLVAQLCLTLL